MPFHALNNFMKTSKKVLILISTFALLSSSLVSSASVAIYYYQGSTATTGGNKSVTVRDAGVMVIDLATMASTYVGEFSMGSASDIRDYWFSTSFDNAINTQIISPNGESLTTIAIFEKNPSRYNGYVAQYQSAVGLNKSVRIRDISGPETATIPESLNANGLVITADNDYDYLAQSQGNYTFDSEATIAANNAGKSYNQILQELENDCKLRNLTQWTACNLIGTTILPPAPVEQILYGTNAYDVLLTVNNTIASLQSAVATNLNTTNTTIASLQSAPNVVNTPLQSENSILFGSIINTTLTAPWDITQLTPLVSSAPLSMSFHDATAPLLSTLPDDYRILTADPNAFIPQTLNKFSFQKNANGDWNVVIPNWAVSPEMGNLALVMHRFLYDHWRYSPTINNPLQLPGAWTMELRVLFDPTFPLGTKDSNGNWRFSIPAGKVPQELDASFPDAIIWLLIKGWRNMPSNITWSQVGPLWPWVIEVPIDTLRPLQVATPVSSQLQSTAANSVISSLPSQTTPLVSSAPLSTQPLQVVTPVSSPTPAPTPVATPSSQLPPLVSSAPLSTQPLQVVTPVSSPTPAPTPVATPSSQLPPLVSSAPLSTQPLQAATPVSSPTPAPVQTASNSAGSVASGSSGNSGKPTKSNKKNNKSGGGKPKKK